MSQPPLCHGRSSVVRSWGRRNDGSDGSGLAMFWIAPSQGQPGRVRVLSPEVTCRVPPSKAWSSRTVSGVRRSPERHKVG
jgi:hypothetical protein